ncbi:hypothetical protein CANARDRAFT_5838 [[Candida] arabinofermentans NRRL YB-2248]|uniref:Cation/H+ exchanger transmembrane domain-containing protein n=1 Tax=[Candida] arabinofermentans NRRL YB-2248 TaxID=983967 RepID=A0A1E4T6F3_9ASCO|nr:hypothetical protein CANARDRAFT_5838 [[Candida] arabinofermentans NRRL YB-2248]
MVGTVTGIIAGADPLEYTASSPYTVFFFQAVFIILLAQAIYYPLSYIKQPRVIAEVITGIILGPSVLGYVPKFTETVFPDGSVAGLTLVANIGVCLLLFMVGCEVDVQFIKKNFKIALSVGIFNMAVPFGLGCAISVGLWEEYRKNDESLAEIKFTTFMVFIAVAMCITAFPVLARILTELRLVKDRVGIIVLAAGITNDLLGWILLALSITLANATKSETTAYIVLVIIGYCLFAVFPIRWCLHWLLDKKLKDIDNPNGPSQFATMTILIMMLISAFFTDIIGVHPIFGAFIIGTIVPRKNNYVIKLTERIEDLVNIIFVPLYFALAGLSVDLGLLNRGIDWAYIVGIIAVALVGKIFGGFVAAKYHGLYWRESLTVGILMSCKGIVEIVVLNTGLKAGIITQKTFSMFILMAIVATFLTTPMTLLSYPQSYRDKVQEMLKAKQKQELENRRSSNNEKNGVHIPPSIRNIDNYSDVRFSKLILPVNNLESVSTDLILLDHLSQPTKLPIHGINVKTLTQRTADLLQASMLKDDNYKSDEHRLNSILSIIKIFSDLNKIPFSSEIIFCLPEDYLKTMLFNSTYSSNDLLILSINNREYYSNPGFLNEFGSLSKEARYHKCLFINNNQEISKKHPIEDEILEQIDTGSLLSNETILNPNSFHISTLNLIINNQDMSEQDLVALKIFSIMVDHKDIVIGNILVQDSNQILQVINEQEELIKNPKVKINIHSNDYTDLKSSSAAAAALDVNDSFAQFVSLNYEPTHSNIKDLVLITENEQSEMFVKRLVENNDKVLIVY